MLTLVTHILKTGMAQKLAWTLFEDSTLHKFLTVVNTINFEMLGILIYMIVINKYVAEKHWVSNTYRKELHIKFIY